MDMSNTSQVERDASRIDVTDLPSRAFPESAQRRPGFQVVIRQSVLNEIYTHGRSVEGIEVGGVLVGTLYRDAHGPFLYIDASIRGEQAAARDTQVTFTAETWQHIQEIMDERYPEKRIVGWYHTHPGFGIFLSDMDLFIQENFFALAWQVAFVFDPVSLEEGLFVWRDGKTVREPISVEPDVQRLALRPGEALKPDPVTAGAVGNDRLARIERMQKTLLAMLLIVALIAILWPIVLFVLIPSGAEPAAAPANNPAAPAFER
jgi:proteasome lid subunit RPN8/RPN11